MRPLLLYKVHEDEDCDKFLNIVRYLHAIFRIDILPITIKERSFPSNIKVLPTIIVNKNLMMEGINNITSYYEKKININNLLDKSDKFIKLNQNYRITDK